MMEDVEDDGGVCVCVWEGMGWVCVRHEGIVLLCYSSYVIKK